MPELQDPYGEMWEVLKKIEGSLEQMLVGEPFAPIAPSRGLPQINRILELVNMLSGNFAELSRFARELGKGNLGVDIPGRRNYLAAPLKALHSQLSSFVWTAEQLQKGYAVDTLDYMGELSAALNGLIERMDQQAGPSPTAETGKSAGRPPYELLSIFNRLPLMILVTDSQGNILFTNTPAIRGLGKLSQPLTNDACTLEGTLRAYSGEGNIFPAYAEIWDACREKWYKVASDQIPSAKDEPMYLHTVEDISDWKLNERHLQRSATLDPLTSVYNRAAGIKILEAALASKERVASCVAFIDVDGLKSVNDTYGHSEGDYVINTIAGILAASLRDSDAVSRYGGDEFLLVFTGCQIGAAEKVIERVQKSLDVTNATNGKPYTISFSYGMAQVDRECDLTAKQLINLTDKKMYERKQAQKKKGNKE